MRRFAAFQCLFWILALVLASSTHADRGVGVNVGRLDVATHLAPGGGYYLPKISVINTGDEVTTYELSVGYTEDQVQRRPDKDWFSFDPHRLLLMPGESRDVIVGIDLPASAQSGEYFALVRAQTVADQPGVTSVGIAAATKLSFTVASAGWFDAQRHRISRWIDDSEPWIYLLPTALLLGFLATKLRGLPFRMRIERK